jgi:hypothetical protein
VIFDNAMRQTGTVLPYLFASRFTLHQKERRSCDLDFY